MKSVGEAMAIGRTFKEACRRRCAGWRSGAPGSSAPELPRRRRAATRRSGADRRAAPGPALVRSRDALPARHDASRRSTDAHGDRPVVPAQHRARSSRSRSALRAATARRARGAGCAARSSSASPTAQLGRAAGARREDEVRALRRAARRAARLQARRHLRRRVRGVHAVPLLDLRGRETRRAPTDRQQGHDPRRRAEPHRPGHRVRLLLLPRGVRAARGRASRRSWSTATRRRSRPTTTRATGSTSSR